MDTQTQIAQMPAVAQCQATECAYNQGRKCHALAITIGDAENPQCDTFIVSSTNGGDSSVTARVGACKVSKCKYNRSLECSAPNISVGYMKSEVSCTTFDPV